MGARWNIESSSYVSSSKVVLQLPIGLLRGSALDFQSSDFAVPIMNKAWSTSHELTSLFPFSNADENAIDTMGRSI